MGTVFGLLFFGLPVLWLLAWPIRIALRGGIVRILGGSGLLLAEIYVGWLIIKVIPSSITVAQNPLEEDAVVRQQAQQIQARIDAYNALSAPKAGTPATIEANPPKHQISGAAQETNSKLPEQPSTKP